MKRENKVNVYLSLFRQINSTIIYFAKKYIRNYAFCSINVIYAAWIALKSERKGGIIGLGSSGYAYVGEFHPKGSKFGTIVHLDSKT